MLRLQDLHHDGSQAGYILVKLRTFITLTISSWGLYKTASKTGYFFILYHIYRYHWRSRIITGIYVKSSVYDIYCYKLAILHDKPKARQDQSETSIIATCTHYKVNKLTKLKILNKLIQL